MLGQTRAHPRRFTHLPALLLAASAALVSLSPEAKAQNAPIDQARMKSDMERYFHGEKWEGPFFFGAGAVATGVIQMVVGAADGFVFKTCSNLHQHPGEAAGHV